MKTRIAVPLVATLAVALAAGCSRTTDEQAAVPAPASPKVAAATPPPAATPAPAAAPTSLGPPPTLSGDAISDSIITTRIKAGILSDPGMTGTDVSVNTDHGVVSLTGIIKSQEQAAIASAHAQRQDGVMRVDNQLAVNLH